MVPSLSAHLSGCHQSIIVFYNPGPHARFDCRVSNQTCQVMHWRSLIDSWRSPTKSLLGLGGACGDWLSPMRFHTGRFLDGISYRRVRGSEPLMRGLGVDGMTSNNGELCFVSTTLYLSSSIASAVWHSVSEQRQRG